MTKSETTELPDGDLWELIEASIDTNLGRNFDHEKRTRLFAAHVLVSSQRTTLVTSLEQPNGCPITFFKDYLLTERFFFKEAAEILGADDFERLFSFPIDKIDAHLELEEFMQESDG